MTTFLIILVLGAIIGGVVVWTRRKGDIARPHDDRQDQDTAWNDPVGGQTPEPPETRTDSEPPLR